METFSLLLIILVVSRIFEEIAERIGTTAVLGDMFAGFLLGPVLFDLIKTNSTLDFLGFIGVIFLMVLAGLEVNLKETKKMTFSASLVAIMGVLIPFLGGLLISPFFGLNLIESVIVGIALTITASAVITEVLIELKQIRTKIGETLVVAGVLDDIIGLVSITILIIITQTSTTSISIFNLFSQLLFFFIASFVAGYYVFPKILEFAQNMKSPEAKFSIALILVFSFGAFAEFEGINAIVGAFIAGLALNHHMVKKDKYGFEKDIKALSEGFMIPIFFVLIGSSITLSIFSGNIWFLITIIIIAFLGKILGGALGGYLGGHNLNESLTIGTGMATRGAVTLVVVHVAYQIYNQNPSLVPNINLIASTLIAMVFLVNLITLPFFRRFLLTKTNK